MTPIEILALIFIVIAAIKIIVILVKPSAWLDSVVKKVWSNPIVTVVISIILAALVLRYLLQELTILQIFAAMLFTALLAAIGMAAYSKEIIGMAEKMLKNRAVIKKGWLAIIIWILLLLWGLIELLA